MKLNKIFIGVLCMLTAVFSSCSEDEYTPAEILTNAQVYFSDAIPTSYSFIMADSVQTLEIPLSRIKTSDEITVKLAVEGADGDTISIPESVTFAAGDTTVVIPVKYNPALVGFNNKINVSIKLAEDVYKTIYGYSSFDFSIVIPAPWKSLGKAKYSEGFITSFYGTDPVEYEVEIQENELTPGFYRLVNAYGKAYKYNDPGDWDTSKDYYLEIHAEDPSKVYITTQAAGNAWSYGKFYFSSLAGYYISAGAPEKAEGFYGTLEGGIITFPANSLLIAMANYNDGQLYTTNAGEEFRIILPGYTLADYSVSVEYLGFFTNSENQSSATIVATLGSDAKTVKAAVVSADADEDAVAEAIVAGEIEATDIVDGQNYVPVGDATGELKVVVVSLNGNTIKDLAVANFEYYGTMLSPWKVYGKATYSDDFVASLFSDADTVCTYEVDVLQHEDNPGLFRLVNPYGEVFPLNKTLNWDGKKHYLEIDATDPECVLILPQNTGLSYKNSEIYVASYGGYQYSAGMTVEDIKKNNLGGTLVNGVITLPNITAKNSQGEEYTYQGITFIGSKGYNTCSTGFKVTLVKEEKAKLRKVSSYKRVSFNENSMPATNRRFVSKKIAGTPKKAVL